MEPIFSFEEQVYRDTTLEVLSTFEVDWELVGFDRVGTINFQLLSEQRHQCYTKFLLLIELYDTDFNSTPQYKQLFIDFLPNLTAKGNIWAEKEAMSQASWRPLTSPGHPQVS